MYNNIDGKRVAFHTAELMIIQNQLSSKKEPYLISRTEQLESGDKFIFTTKDDEKYSDYWKFGHIYECGKNDRTEKTIFTVDGDLKYTHCCQPHEAVKIIAYPEQFTIEQLNKIGIEFNDGDTLLLAYNVFRKCKFGSFGKPKCIDNCECPVVDVKVRLFENKIMITKNIEPICIHPPQNRVKTHRGFHCGDCGKRF